MAARVEKCYINIVSRIDFVLSGFFVAAHWLRNKLYIRIPFNNIGLLPKIVNDKQID